MRYKVLVLIGFVLIGAGAIALSYRGIPYTSRDVVIDAGPITATAASNRTWPVPSAVSGTGSCWWSPVDCVRCA